MIPDEEYRRNIRIREEIPVDWVIRNTERCGKGVIRDISVSGVLIELNTFFKPEKSMVFLLKARNPEDGLEIPDQARLIWCRPMKSDVGVFLCGMEFVSPEISIVEKLARHVEAWFVKMAEGSNVNILAHYFKPRNGRE